MIAFLMRTASINYLSLGVSGPTRRSTVLPSCAGYLTNDLIYERT